MKFLCKPFRTSSPSTNKKSAREIRQEKIAQFYKDRQPGSSKQSQSPETPESPPATYDKLDTILENKSVDSKDKIASTSFADEKKEDDLSQPEEEDEPVMEVKSVASDEHAVGASLEEDGDDEETKDGQHGPLETAEAPNAPLCGVCGCF